MISLSNKSNLLEQDTYHYELQDVTEPNLYRDVFPFTEVPKVTFNHRHVPIEMPQEIYITDTTFRDGQQARSPYTPGQIAALYEYMHRLGGADGLIRQTEFFVYSKKDRKALEMCMEKGYKFPEITTWIRASMKDFRLVKDLGIQETGILMSCSDYHIFKKMNLTRASAMEQYLEVAREAIATGLCPRCHLEDITRADIYGFVVPLVYALNELGREANIPIKIRACDTLGLGVPFPGAALPRSVPGIVYGLHTYAQVPSHLIEWHGHNDFGLGVANACTAWLYGASAVNCSLLGIGERTGNVPLEIMAMQLASFRGSDCGMDLSVISEIAAYYEEELGYKVPPMSPFVGRDFNATRAGIHADGMLKDREIYNIFDTQKLLNKEVCVAITNVSGTSGIAYWINSHFRLSKAEAVSKTDPLVIKVKDWVDTEYEAGRVTSISDEEILACIREFEPHRFIS
jgi:isopropylmalate/homocitrate/citramalate synthase